MSGIISQRQYNKWLRHVLDFFTMKDQASFRREEGRQRKKEGRASWEKELFCRRICYRTKKSLTSWVNQMVHSLRLFDKLACLPKRILIRRLKQKQKTRLKGESLPKGFRKMVADLQDLLREKTGSS